MLFDEIQVAIHDDDRTKIDYLMAELADATRHEEEDSSTVRLQDDRLA